MWLHKLSLDVLQVTCCSSTNSFKMESTSLTKNKQTKQQQQQHKKKNHSFSGNRLYLHDCQLIPIDYKKKLMLEI